MLITSNGEFNFKIHLEYPFTSLVLCKALCFQLYEFQYTRLSSAKSFFPPWLKGMKNLKVQITGRGLALPRQGEHLKRAFCPSRVAVLLAGQGLCGLCRFPSLQEDERNAMCRAQEIRKLSKRSDSYFLHSTRPGGFINTHGLSCPSKTCFSQQRSRSFPSDESRS